MWKVQQKMEVRMMMKHKVIASSYSSFTTLFDELLRRLSQTNQTVVKSKFYWDNDSHKGFMAKLWTKEMNNGQPS